jgi:hypothetical protein
MAGSDDTVWRKVQSEIESFPRTFGLQGGFLDTFTILEGASIDASDPHRVILYLGRLQSDGTWAPFQRTTPDDLRQSFVRRIDPNVERVARQLPASFFLRRMPSAGPFRVSLSSYMVGAKPVLILEERGHDVMVVEDVDFLRDQIVMEKPTYPAKTGYTKATAAVLERRRAEAEARRANRTEAQAQARQKAVDTGLGYVFNGRNAMNLQSGYAYIFDPREHRGVKRTWKTIMDEAWETELITPDQMTVHHVGHRNIDGSPVEVYHDQVSDTFVAQSAQMVRNGRTDPKTIVGTTGDADPFTFGGGVVFRNKYGIHWWFWDEPDEANPQYVVYRTSVPDDVLGYHTFAKTADMAATMDVPASDIRRMSTSKNVMDRVHVLEMIAGYYGAENLDSYPETYTLAGLKRFLPRQFTRNGPQPNHGNDPHSLTWGVMPPLAEFRQHLSDYYDYTSGERQSITDDDPKGYVFYGKMRGRDADEMRRVRLSGVDFDGENFTVATIADLHKLIKSLSRSSREQANDLASGMMTVLGYEWV